MIVGLGIDSVAIARFSQWATHFPTKQLERIFHPSEISYALSQPRLSAQRFATRFAAREAFFKAWHAAYPTLYVPFLTLCKRIYVARDPHNRPILMCNWDLFGALPFLCTSHISTTDTEFTATVCIILEKFSG